MAGRGRPKYIINFIRTSFQMSVKQVRRDNMNLMQTRSCET